MSAQKNEIKPSIPPIDWSQSAESAALAPLEADAAALLSMPLNRAVIRLAGPAVASFFSILIFNLVDGWWVGKLGAIPLAGVSGASFVYWALEALGTMASTGISALVAQHIGARQPQKAKYIAGQGLMLALALGIVFGGLTFLLQETMISYMGMSGEVARSARQYLIFIEAGLFLLFASLAVEAVFRGMGDTRTPFKIISGALLLNAALDPFFIFGIGPFPRLEAAGAALATVFSHGLAFVIGMWVLRRRKIRITFFKAGQKLIHTASQIQIIRIGAPIAFSGMMFSITYMLLTRVITQFGPEPLAALGLGHRLEGLPFFTALGFSVAASTLVGQNKGAGDLKRAEQSAWRSLLFAGIILALLSLLFFIFAEPLYRFFIDEVRVVQEGRDYLRIIALFEVFLAFEIVLQGAFSGAGHSMPPMLISVPITLARVPLAIFLAQTMGLGSTGIWWAISLTTAAKGVVIGIWFKSGTWKKRII
ncbi:MATE family efflux transporter [candidate division KSB1 bacterium]|nr:MATE family efflux transporter [candidate division KSB1 bacterium]